MVYRTGFWVCMVLVLFSVILRSFQFNSLVVLFHHHSCDCYWYFYGHYFSFELHDFWLSSSGSANAHPPGYFHRWTFPLNIRLNILPSDSFMSYLDSLLGYSTGLVPGFATDCPCVVWCCGLNTCLLYYGSLFGNLVWNDSGFISLT